MKFQPGFNDTRLRSYHCCSRIACPLPTESPTVSKKAKRIFATANLRYSMLLPFILKESIAMVTAIRLVRESLPEFTIMVLIFYQGKSSSDKISRKAIPQQK